jgi:hypothetical protein
LLAATSTSRQVPIVAGHTDGLESLLDTTWLVNETSLESSPATPTVVGIDLLARAGRDSPKRFRSREWQGVLHPRATNRPEVLLLDPDHDGRDLDQANPLPGTVVEAKFKRISKVTDAGLIECPLGTEPVGRR